MASSTFDALGPLSRLPSVLLLTAEFCFPLGCGWKPLSPVFGYREGKDLVRFLTLRLAPHCPGKQLIVPITEMRKQRSQDEVMEHHS